MYHMYDADIALPVVGEVGITVGSGRGELSSVHGLFKQRKMVGILLRDVMARGREAVRSGGDVAPEEGQISGSGKGAGWGRVWSWGGPVDGRHCGGLGGRGFAGGHWGEGDHSPNVERCHKNATLASTIENRVRLVEAGDPVMDKNPEHVIPPFQPAVQPQERRQLG